MILCKRKDTAKTFALYRFALFFALMLSACVGKPEVVEAPVTIGNLLNPEAENLVRRGVSYHDRGDYKSALDYYNQAMALDPDHPVICFETAYTYLSSGDLDKALSLADKGISSAETRKYHEVVPQLLDLKGSILYNLNRNQEAIDVYTAAINQYHVSNTFIYYNLGINYYALNKRDKAVEMLVNGLLINANHASSNYLLGKICVEDGKLTQGVYALCYFLLQEPTTNRADQAYNTIQYLLSGQEQSQSGGSFAAADRVILAANTLDAENAGKSDVEQFRAKLRYCFTNLEEQKKSGGIRRAAGDELWWDFYSPFFYRIMKSDTYSPAFFRCIGLSADPDAEKWIETERDEIEGFFDWLNQFPD